MRNGEKEIGREERERERHREREEETETETERASMCVPGTGKEWETRKITTVNLGRTLKPSWLDHHNMLTFSDRCRM